MHFKPGFKTVFSSRCLLVPALLFLSVSKIRGIYGTTPSVSVPLKEWNYRKSCRNLTFQNRRGVTALVHVPIHTYTNIERKDCYSSKAKAKNYGSITAAAAAASALDSVLHSSTSHLFMTQNHQSNKYKQELLPSAYKFHHSRNLLMILQLSRGGARSSNNQNEKSTSNTPIDKTAKTKAMKNIAYAVSISLLITLIALNKDAIQAFNFKEQLALMLDTLSSMGTKGLVTYIVLFLVWELVVGVTTPVETAAGMAFGFQNGIIANAIGKSSGAIIAFLLGRFVLKEFVADKLEGNEYLDLVKESITKHPIRVALIWRFSFLPEQIKNFGLAILPLKTWQFVTAVLLHGFPFTVLWTFMGNEMGLVVKGILDKPSKILKVLIVGVNILGFFISPTLGEFLFDVVK